MTSAYLPTFLSEIGVGAIYPLLTLSVLDMDHSGAAASAVVGAYLAGRMLGSPWGGKLAALHGAAAATLWALAGTAIAALICAFAPDVWSFAAGAALVGVGHAAFHVSRQAQVVAVVPKKYRARSLTTLAGVWRISNFIGPVVGAALIAFAGLWLAYVFAAATIIAGAVALMPTHHWRERVHHVRAKQTSVREVVRENWRVISTLGVAVALTGALRAARLVAITVWAEHLGMSDERATAIFAVSAAVDMLLFWPAGVAMDKRGRRATAIPSTLLLAIGTLAMPLAWEVVGVTLLAVVLGVGNGWGSGLLMTLGSDVAPAHGRPIFTGIWMFLQDVGGLAGPALISLGALVALPLGFFAVGGIGAGTAGLLHKWIPPWRLQPGG